MSEPAGRGALEAMLGGPEALRLFMEFPDPLALLGPDGNLTMTNRALRARFAAASVVPGTMPAAGAEEGGVCRLSLVAPDQGGVLEVAARVVRMSPHTLLVLDDPATLGGSSQGDELSRLRDQVNRLRLLAATDHLTGAWNRAHFDRLIEAELARSASGRVPVSLVLIDIDHFKRVNDTFGHDAGDAVLRELVRVVQGTVRGSDVLFRWGGEEFAVLAGSAGYRAAERLAERLCRAVAAHDFGAVGRVTVSLGVAEHQGGESPDAWFRRLDEALFAAKRGGRNRVVVDRAGSSDTWAAGAPVLHLQWLEAYESGESAIDQDHQAIFGLANALIDAASQARRDPRGVQAAFETLTAHVVGHFAAEEALLEARGFDGLKAHAAAHASLLRRAMRLKTQVDAGQASLGALIEFLVQDVVAGHMLAVDRVFFPLFARESGAAPAVDTRGAPAG